MTEKYYKELLPLDLYKEAFIKFYGEANRKKIEALFNKANFILLPKSLEGYELGKHIRQKFPQLKDVEIEEVIFALDSSLHVLKGELEHAKKECFQKVYSKFGLDNLMKINPETQQYEWVSVEAKNEFHKIASAINGNNNLTKLLIETGLKYNNPAVVEYLKTELRKNAASELAKKFIESCKSTNSSNEPELIPNVIEGVENNPKLMGKIAAIISSKIPVQEHLKSEETSQFVLNTIKEVFGVEFSNVNDCLNDYKFMNVVSQLQNHQKAVIFEENKMMTKEQEQFVNEMVSVLNANNKEGKDTINESVININLENFIGNWNTIAYFSTSLGNDTPEVVLPISGDLRLDHILHEINHLIQSHKTQSDGLQSGFNSGLETVAPLDGAQGKLKLKYEFFNEIVNEYLTREMMRTIVVGKEPGIDKQFPLSIKGECAYSRGIELLKPFLDKYKQILKQAVISKDPMVFRDRILGAENFDKLAEFVNTYLSADEQKYLNELSQVLGKSINSAKDIIANKDEISRLNLSGNLSKFIESVDGCNKLSLRCVENIDKLINGEKINMISEWEHQVGSEKQLELQ